MPSPIHPGPGQFCAAAVLTLSLGCSRPSELARELPASPVGTFTLSRVDDVTVPVEWDAIHLAGDVAIRMYLLSGTAAFQPDSSFTSTVRARLVTGGGAPDQDLAFTATGTWRLLDDGHFALRTSQGDTARWRASQRISSFRLPASYPSLDGREASSTLTWIRD